MFSGDVSCSLGDMQEPNTGALWICLGDYIKERL